MWWRVRNHLNANAMPYADQRSCGRGAERNALQHVLCDRQGRGSGAAARLRQSLRPHQHAPLPYVGVQAVACIPAPALCAPAARARRAARRHQVRECSCHVVALALSHGHCVVQACVCARGQPRRLCVLFRHERAPQLLSRAGALCGTPCTRQHKHQHPRTDATTWGRWAGRWWQAWE